MIRRTVAFALAALSMTAVAQANVIRSPYHAVRNTGIGAGWAATASHALVPVKGVDLGAVVPTMPMRVTVVLNMKDKAGALAYVKREYTKGDPAFHQFLTPAQYRAAFNPTGAQVNAVGSYLSSQGFTNIVASSNNLLVTGSATAAVVQRAFSTSVHNFALPDGSIRYMNVTPALVPSALGNIVMSVIGLHDVPQHRFFEQKLRPRHVPAPTMSANRRVAAAKHRLASSSGSFSCAANGGNTIPGANICIQDYLWAGDLRVAYDDQGSATAANTNVAIFTNGNAAPLVTDLRQYEAINGERQVPVNIVQVDLPSNDESGFVEYQMDTQTSTAIAGDVKSLYLYNPGGFTDQDSILAYERFDSDDLAQTVSGSYGECEYDALLDGTLGPADALFLQGVAQGQSYFFSSGDNGTSCGFTELTNGFPTVVPPALDYPASSPFVTAAGGTTLLVSDTTGAYYAEVGWNGSGGGISYLESPAYWMASTQSLTTEAGAVGVYAGREVPDVAMAADCITIGDAAAIIVEGAQTGNCGTSLASPLAMGAYARLESAFNNQLGAAGPALYGAYQNFGGYSATSGCDPTGVLASLGLAGTCGPTPTPTLPSAGVYDPLIGGFKDIQFGPNGIYQTTPGYDMVTGMGSFDINQMMVSFGKG